MREQAKEIVRQVNPRSDGNDVNYIFLTFVLRYLPVGVVGLVLAMIFAASMSSTASELNALASTTIVDFYRRFGKRERSDRHLVAVSKAATVVWGGLAILFAEYANRLGSLVEAVNILGSLFYGTILGHLPARVLLQTRPGNGRLHRGAGRRGRRHPLLRRHRRSRFSGTT